MLSSRHVHTGAAPGAALLGSYRHTHTIRNQNYGSMTPSNLGYCGIVAIEHLGFYHKLVDSKPISTPDFLSKTLRPTDIETEIPKFQYRPRKFFSRHGEQFGGIRDFAEKRCGECAMHITRAITLMCVRRSRLFLRD